MLLLFNLFGMIVVVEIYGMNDLLTKLRDSAVLLIAAYKLA